MATRTLAIMFTDIKGFTARTSGESRAELVHLLDEHDKLLRPVFAHFRGTIVKTIGDAFLVWFDSPTDAVVCGVTIQEVLRKHNAIAVERERIEVRVSINIGDVELRVDEASGQMDIFGEAVNLAARLEGITDAGEVWFTEAVYLTMNRHETPTAEVGERTFKGIPNPVRVYKVLRDEKSDQLQRIADSVKIIDGVPSLGGLPRATGAPRAVPAPAHRTAYALWASIAIGAIAIGGIGFALFRGHARADALAVARDQVNKGNFEAAVAVVDEQLRGGGQDAEFESIGLLAEQSQLDAKARQMPPAKAVEWARSEIAVHPWARAMKGSLPQLETEALLWDAQEKGEPLPEAELEKLLAQYPDDATVPYTAARIEEHGGIPQYTLKWFEMALERGGYKGDAHIRELCEETFSDFGPGAAWTTTAQRIEKKYYAKERVLWAEKHLDQGGANEFINAMTIFADEKRPEADDTFRRDLRDLLAGSNDEGLRNRLRGERDPAHRKRVAELVRSGLKYDTFDADHRDALEAFLKTFEKG